MVKTGESFKNGSLNNGTSALASSPSQGGPTSDELSKAIQAVKKATGVPTCVKKALDLLARQFVSILDEKNKVIEQLRNDNKMSREKIAICSEAVHNSSVSAVISSLDRNVTDQFHVVKEAERRKSVVIGGVPESKCQFMSDRVVQDFNQVRKVLDFLDVQCERRYTVSADRPIIEIGF